MLFEAQIDLAGLRCLIVEDVTIMAETERRLLSRLGAHVVVAGGVKEALRVLATQPLDVLIVDIGLPDGDGSEVVLAARAASPNIAVLAVSGIRDRARDLKLQAMGAVIMDKDALAEHLPLAVEAARSRMTISAPGFAMVAPTLPSEGAASAANRCRLLARAASCSANAVVARYAAEHRLTEREHEVFALSFQGLADKDIGRALHISYSTVRAHWHRIATKTGCEGQCDVMRQFACCLLGALARVERDRDIASNRT